MSQMIDFFPFAQKTKKEIEHHNKFLSKISLTGKINANSFSENLFTYTDQTIIKFDLLKEELIDALVDENIAKLQDELSLKAQLAIDVLKRNLFERTADVGFLATDDEIINFLQDDSYDIDKIEFRLNEYVKKYSVYDDVIIFDTNANVKVNINKENSFTHSNDKILDQALKSDTYVEQYTHSDIFATKQKALLYAQKITSAGRSIGVLVLSFKFEDELMEIFKSLSLKDEVILLEDFSGVIASSNQKLIKNNSRISLSKRNNMLFFNNKFAIRTGFKGYQGYTGLPWKSVAISLNSSEEVSQVDQRLTLPQSLKRIIDEAYESVEDLADVIINGELIASKYREFSLSPILENLRVVSEALVQTINKSAQSLANIKTSSLLSSAKISTSFAMDLMDRNLYERANDCRWWALTPTFAEQLSCDNPDIEKLTNVLKYINELYTVYTDLVLFDTNGKIIAASNNNTLVGRDINMQAVSATLQNRDTQKYFVSDFEKTSLYEDQATYIYFASIFDKQKVLGGIGIVFDSSVEFKAILEDSQLEGQKGFSVICDKNQMVISSTDEKYKPLDKLDLPSDYFKEGREFQSFIEYEKKRYLCTIAPSKGYREYKKEDNYSNDIFVVTFIEV